MPPPVGIIWIFFSCQRRYGIRRRWRPPTISSWTQTPPAGTMMADGRGSARESSKRGRDSVRVWRPGEMSSSAGSQNPQHHSIILEQGKIGSFTTYGVYKVPNGMMPDYLTTREFAELDEIAVLRKCGAIWATWR